MEHPKFKKIRVECTLGWIVRDDIISNPILINETYEGYYHFLHGYMIRGKDDVFKYGWIPFSGEVKVWRFL